MGLVSGSVRVPLHPLPFLRNVYCTYYRDSNELTCGFLSSFGRLFNPTKSRTVTCETHVPIGTQSGRAEGEDGLDAKLPRQIAGEGKKDLENGPGGNSGAGTGSAR